jgi:hypothetical protein
MTTVWIVPSSKQSSLAIFVNSLNRTHVLLSFNVISPSSGGDVINVSQWRKGQDVKHVTMVIRVMGMVVVFHVHLMNAVLQTQYPPQELIIVLNVMMMGMDVGSVQKGIILMMNLVHV